MAIACARASMTCAKSGWLLSATARAFASRAVAHDDPPARADSASWCTRLAVVGAGQMGTGIAYVAALNAKVPVLLSDTSQQQIDAALAHIDGLLTRSAQKGRVSMSDAAAARARVSGCVIPVSNNSSVVGRDGDIDAARLTVALPHDTAAAIEAVPEKPALKARLLRLIATAAPNLKLLATNTSSISVTWLASAATSNVEGEKTVSGDCFIGMHFMNPVPVMPGVEVIPGLATSKETITRTRNLANAMGKTSTLSRDAPGFIANRVLMPYINEAIFALSENIGTPEDIDQTLVLGANMPMGPLALADLIGLDTTLAILNVLHTQHGDPKFRPCPLLRTYVNAGWLGRKSGRGFYTYSKTPAENKKSTSPPPQNH